MNKPISLNGHNMITPTIIKLIKEARIVWQGR